MNIVKVCATTRRRGGLCMAWLMTALLLAPYEAYAHAALVKSDPGRRAVIKAAPKEIRLWFNEKLEPAFSSVVLLGADGEPVAAQPAAVSNDDPKRIILPLNPLPPGVYRVKYRVMSVDGHVVESSFKFTIQPVK